MSTVTCAPSFSATYLEHEDVSIVPVGIHEVSIEVC